MAYLANYAPGKKTTLEAGAGPDPSAGAGAPGGGAPATAPPQASGAFTDFGAYLNANKEQASSLAGKLSSGIGSEATQAGAAAPTQTFTAGTAAQGHYAWNDPGRPWKGRTWVDDAAATPGKLTTDVTAPNAARQSALGDLNATAQRGGIEALLAKSAAPGYTQGQSSFDSALLGGSGINQSMDALRAKYAPLLQPLVGGTINTPAPPGNGFGTVSSAVKKKDGGW